MKSVPSQSAERIEYLDIVCARIRKVEEDTIGHSEEVIGYMTSIQSKVFRLQTVISKNIKNLQSHFVAQDLVRPCHFHVGKARY